MCFRHYVARFGTAKLESDIDILFAAIPRRFFLSDFCEIVKHILGTAWINAAHVQESNVPAVKIVLHLLASHPGLQDSGIRA